MQIHVFFGVQKAKVSSRCLHYFPAATNLSFPYWALQISAKHFDEYLKFGKKHWPKLGFGLCETNYFRLLVDTRFTQLDIDNRMND